MLKRLFDITFSFLGLLLLSLVFVPIAISIKLDSRGPILFRQTRIGRHGQSFTIYKFRTMAWQPNTLGAQITVGHDQRITKVGRFLRKAKADELPQLMNVLLGEMSIVGPRPEVAKYVNLYPQHLRDIILSVRPGITDLASIEFINESQILAESADSEKYYVEIILPAKLRIYVKYAQNFGIVEDLNIIFLTLKKLII